MPQRLGWTGISPQVFREPRLTHSHPNWIPPLWAVLLLGSTLSPLTLVHSASLLSYSPQPPVGLPTSCSQGHYPCSQGAECRAGKHRLRETENVLPLPWSSHAKPYAAEQARTVGGSGYVAPDEMSPPRAHILQAGTRPQLNNPNTWAGQARPGSANTGVLGGPLLPGKDGWLLG